MNKKTALITGASGGIGGATAKRLAADYRIAVHYNQNREQAEKLCREINSSGGMASPFCCNISDSTQVKEMFADIKRQLGGVHLLVNNAAVALSKLIIDMTDDDWNRIISANLSGCFYCCREALREMVYKQSGVIINMSSIWGITGASCEAAYSAAKAGVIGLTKALAKEYGPSGIRVNCVAPGVIDTPMNSNLAESDMDELREETPLGRIGAPNEIADVVAFLASEQAGFITGQVISPNGGIVI